MLAPIMIPYKVLKYFTLLPIRLTIDFVDSFIELTLNRLKMTKKDAKIYAKEWGKKQLYWMRTLLIILVILIAVFSVSLGFSATVYSGLYLYLIPQHCQQHFLNFNYVPVEQDQKQ